MDSLVVGRTWLAVSTTELYWTISQNEGGCLGKVALTGGTPSSFGSTYPDVNAVAVDADNLYWFVSSSPDPSPGPIFEQILKAPLAGGTPSSVAITVSDVGSIVFDDTSVYFTDTGGGDVVKVTPK
jgi:hypothetical protein